MATMADEAVWQSALDTRRNTVGRMIGVSAVLKAIEDPPFASRNQAIKDGNTEVVLDALSTCSDQDMAEVVEKLDMDQVDILMKYVYKGLEKGENSGNLFKWHAKLAQKGGLGTVVRAMTDRKTA